MKKRILITTFILLLLAFPLMIAHGATTDGPQAPLIGHPSTLPGMEITEETANADVRSYFLNTFAPTYIGGFIAMMGGITFLMVVINGIQYLVSYGNDDKMKNATKGLTFSVLGLVLSLLAWSIVSIVSNISLGGQPDREVGVGEALQTTETNEVKTEETE